MSVEFLKVKRLIAWAQLPFFATAGSACADIYACFEDTPNIAIRPGDAVSIPTGLAFAIPVGYVGLVYSRSGHAAKHKVRLGNCVGVIDSDYRGELKVLLHNEGLTSFIVTPSDRIAQLMLVKLPEFRMVEVAELDETVRGSGGFGSTGT